MLSGRYPIKYSIPQKLNNTGINDITIVMLKFTLLYNPPSVYNKSKGTNIERAIPPV